MPDIFDRLRERRIVGVGAINDKTAETIGRALVELSLEAPEKEIRMAIDSGGGSVAPALALCDVIRSIKTPITGVVAGDCCSMAVAVLQACHKRLSLQHAIFFLHFCTTEFKFSHSLSDEEINRFFARRLQEGRRWQAQNEQFLAARTGKTVEEIRALMREGDKVDARLSAEDALKIGLIDGIVQDPSGFFEIEWCSDGKLFPKEES